MGEPGVAISAMAQAHAISRLLLRRHPCSKAGKRFLPEEKGLCDALTFMKNGGFKMDQNENLPSRWTTDPGAIPGEPYDYLDIPIGEEGEIGEAKAVII